MNESTPGVSPGPATLPSAGGPGTAGEPEVLVRATPEEVSATAAQRIVEGLAAAIDARGRADFVTTGGSAPVGIYTILASDLRNALDWTRVHFWWSDDRYVPRDHPLSNVQAADSILFAAAELGGQSGNLVGAVDVLVGQEPGLAVPVENIHAFPCTAAIAHSRGAEWCAQQYTAELRDAGLHEERGFPIFDVILLGVGPDGHLMSVFPGSDAFDRREWALAIPAPTHVEPHVERVTLNPGVLGVARSVLMVSTGAEKAPVIGRIFRTERDVRVLPSQLVRRSGATWILDRAAAENVPENMVRG